MSPDLALPWRILLILNGFSSRQERESDVLRICPPPSPKLPSISIMLQPPYHCHPVKLIPRQVPVPTSLIQAFYGRSQQFLGPVDLIFIAVAVASPENPFESIMSKAGYNVDVMLGNALADPVLYVDETPIRVHPFFACPAKQTDNTEEPINQFIREFCQGQQV
jgi:hypothetical protein